MIEILYCGIMGYPIGYTANGKTKLFVWRDGKRKNIIEVRKPQSEKKHA